MNKDIKDSLPNPFTTDYEYIYGPLDLYTEAEMEKFAKTIIQRCADFIAEQDDGDNSIYLLMSKKLKRRFGVL